MEDTLKENEALVEEMLRDSKVKVEGDLEKNPIIHKGDSTLEAPITVSKITTPDYVYIWDSRTHRKAPILKYMLSQKLQVRRKDGSYVWTLKDPGKAPKGGMLKCLLHKDSPERELHDSMGLRECGKDNITNDYEVKQHMLKKHPKEWKSLEDSRIERERQEDRAFQKTLYEAVKPTAPLYVKDKK